MRTKSSIIIECMESKGFAFLDYSSAWNIHNNSVGENVNSNVRKTVSAIFKSKRDVKSICAIIGAKGRSQHSKSEILLFDMTGKSIQEQIDAGSYTLFANEFYNYAGQFDE